METQNERGAGVDEKRKKKNICLGAASVRNRSDDREGTAATNRLKTMNSVKKKKNEKRRKKIKEKEHVYVEKATGWPERDTWEARKKKGGGRRIDGFNDAASTLLKRRTRPRRILPARVTLAVYGRGEGGAAVR